MTEHTTIISKYLHSTKTAHIVRFNLITILLFIIVKCYISLDSKERNQITPYFHSSLSNENTTVAYKKCMKKQFHLNIFDREEFNRNEKYAEHGTGPCVQTKLKVKLYMCE